MIRGIREKVRGRREAAIGAALLNPRPRWRARASLLGAPSAALAGWRRYARCYPA